VRHSSFHIDMDRLIGGLKAQSVTEHALSEVKAKPPEDTTSNWRRTPA